MGAVAPKVAVFQAGHRNRYEHPAEGVLQRYRELSIVVVDSPHCGAWSWRSDAPQGQPALGQCVRESARRYWHWHDPERP